MRSSIAANILAFFILIMTAGFGVSDAQPILSPESMALGGAGSAYLNGVESLHFNPANTALHESINSFQIEIASAGSRFDPVNSHSNPRKQWDHFKEYLNIYDPVERNTRFSDLARMQYLQDQYPEHTTRNNYAARFAIQPIALSVHQDNYTISISLRTRTASRFDLGRGWFSDKPVTLSNGDQLLDRTFNQQFQTFHEISIAYAQPLTYLNGLTSNLGRFFVGIAPKFLFGGTFMNAQYKNNYRISASGKKTQIRSFRYEASGAFGRISDDIRKGISTNAAIERNLDLSSLEQSSGYGIGIDVGLTYTYPLGSNLKSVKRNYSGKSMRFSISMTDIGYFHQRKDTRIYTRPTDTTVASVPNELAVFSEKFTGAPGQYHYMIERLANMEQPFQSSSRETGSFMKLLPGTMHGGFALLYDQLTITADIQTTVVSSAYSGSGLSLHSGIEYFILPGWPLRAGFQLRNDNTSLLSVGTGIENRHWEINAGVQFSGETNRVNINLYGAALATLKLNW